MPFTKIFFVISHSYWKMKHFIFNFSNMKLIEENRIAIFFNCDSLLAHCSSITNLLAISIKLGVYMTILSDDNIRDWTPYCLRKSRVIKQWWRWSIESLTTNSRNLTTPEACGPICSRATGTAFQRTTEWSYVVAKIIVENYLNNQIRGG